MVNQLFSIPSLISKIHKKNIICTMDYVQGDFLRPPHGTTQAVVIENKIQTERNDISQRKKMVHTTISAIKASLVAY